MKYKVITLFLILSLPFFLFTGVEASEYPEHELEIIVHYSPGGGVDNTVRLFAPELEDKLGVPIIVNNIAGGGGVVGTTAIHSATPDGYTLGAFNSPATEIGSLSEGVGYTVPDDFRFIGAITNDPYALISNPEGDYQTMEDLIEAARENPGEISIGVQGLLSTGGIALFEMQERLDLELNLIPYDGGAEVQAAVRGGHINAGAVSAARQEPLMEDGEVNVVTIFAPNRMEEFGVLSEVPTFEESTGHDVFASSMRGLVVQKDVPDDRFELLKNKFDEIVQDPEFEERVSRTLPYEYLSSEDFETHVRNTMESVKNIMDEMDEDDIE